MNSLASSLNGAVGLSDDIEVLSSYRSVVFGCITQTGMPPTPHHPQSECAAKGELQDRPEQDEESMERYCRCCP